MGAGGDATRAEVSSQIVQAFDDPGFALGLGRVAAWPGHLVELKQEVFAADDRGRTDAVAAQTAHEVVGLAGPDAEQLLDGLAVDQRGAQGSDGRANSVQVGVPSWSCWHGKRIARRISECAVTQNEG
jgi:hypothetical protein